MKLKVIRVCLVSAAVVCAVHCDPGSGYWAAGLVLAVWALGAVDGIVAAIEVYEDEIAGEVVSEKARAR